MRIKYVVMPRADRGYWVVDTPEGVDTIGPYDSHEEAREAMQGIARFLIEYENTCKRNSKDIVPLALRGRKLL